MNKEFMNIVSIIDNYLTLKDNYKEYHQENLYDVFTIFINEVCEINDISCKIEKTMDNIELSFLNNNNFCKDIMDCYEEELINEIADVLLTTARLIHEFGLYDALEEMIEYKYERQKSRELKRFKNNKNELLK